MRPGSWTLAPTLWRASGAVLPKCAVGRPAPSLRARSRLTPSRQLVLHRRSSQDEFSGRTEENLSQQDRAIGPRRQAGIPSSGLSWRSRAVDRRWAKAFEFLGRTGISLSRVPHFSTGPRRTLGPAFTLSGRGRSCRLFVAIFAGAGAAPRGAVGDHRLGAGERAQRDDVGGAIPRERVVRGARGVRAGRPDSRPHGPGGAHREGCERGGARDDAGVWGER